MPSGRTGGRDAAAENRGCEARVPGSGRAGRGPPDRGRAERGRRCEPDRAAPAAAGYIRGGRARAGGPVRAVPFALPGTWDQDCRQPACQSCERVGGAGREGRRGACEGGRRSCCSKARDGGADWANSRQGRRGAAAPPGPSPEAAGDGGLPLGICLYVLTKQLERPGGGALAAEWRPMLSNGGGERGPWRQWAQGGGAAGPQ